MVLAPCKKRRWMEVTLGQQEPSEASHGAEPAHTVARTWCFDLGSSRGPLLTYRPPPRALYAAFGPALEAIVASPVAFGPA